MDEIDLAERFPEMNPAKRSPALFQWNGIGFALHGQRDRDGETGTYVATHWLTVLWIPLLALGAYRVARAEDGWYVLGKVPASMPAQIIVASDPAPLPPAPESGSAGHSPRRRRPGESPLR